MELHSVDFVSLYEDRNVLTFENQLYYEASDRAPASRNQAASPLCGVGRLRRKLLVFTLHFELLFMYYVQITPELKAAQK